MRYRHGNSVCISSQVGCRNGLRLLRLHRGGQDPESHGGGAAGPGDLYPEGFRGCPSPTSSSWASGSRWTTYANVLKIPHPGQPPGRAEHRHAPYLALHLRPDQGHRPAGGARIYSSRCPFPSTPRTTRPAARSCPSTGPRGWRRSSRPAAGISRRPGGAFRYEYAMIDGVNDTPRQAALLGRPVGGDRGPREPHSPELRGGEQPAPQHPRGRSSSGSWKSGASPPRCAAAWAATLTPRAASCAGKPCGSRPRASDESGDRR